MVNFIGLFFLTGVKEECFYTLRVELTEDNTIFTKPSISKQQSPKQEKQEAINQRALSETMLPLKYKKGKRKEEKTPTILHTQHRAPSIPILISTKRKEQEQRKKRTSHWIEEKE